MSKIKIILIWILTFFVVFLLPFIFTFYKQQQIWITYIADFVTILGLGGLFFAYNDFINKVKAEQRNKLEEQLRAIKTIKHQIEIIGQWTNNEQGGYFRETRSFHIDDWSSIGKIVFEIDNIAIENILSLPGIINFDDNILESIAKTNQEIRNFNSMLSEIRTYRNLALIELRKLNEVESSYIVFLEKVKADMLSMNKILHEKIISNNQNKNLYYWHNNLKIQLETLESDIESKLMVI